MMREAIGTLGVVLLAVGVGLYSRPAGIICAGVFLVLFAIFGFDGAKKTGR